MTAERGDFERPVSDARERLAGLFLKHWRTPTSGCHCGGMQLGESYAQHLADVALSELDALADERAADALEQAGSDLENVPGNPYPLTVHAFLRARAAALRAASSDRGQGS